MAILLELTVIYGMRPMFKQSLVAMLYGRIISSGTPEMANLYKDQANKDLWYICRTW